MFIKLSKNSFVRKFNDLGYIVNQLTKHDRIYDEIGSVFLSTLSRKPKNVNEIINELYRLFDNVSFEEIQSDFYDFIKSLELDHFIVTANNIDELEKKDLNFSYDINNPKTISYSFKQKENQSIIIDTSDFFYSYFRNSPQIVALEIELTKRCNERCIHCYIPINERKSGNDIEIEVILNLLNQAKELNVVEIILSGGEIFLHKDIIKILEYCREKDFIITILSNLTTINEEHIKIFKKLNICQIQVSLYSMDSNEHDKITGIMGSHEKTLNNILKLIDNDIPVQISCPIMSINYKSYKNVLKFAFKKKIKANTDLIMMARTDFTKDNLKFRLNEIELEEVITDIINNDPHYTDLLKNKSESIDIKRFSKKPVCGVGISFICFSSDGNFYPCAGWQGYILGNIYNNSLDEIWKNSQKINFLRTITYESFNECLSCEARDYCSMCMVRNFNESKGDMFAINENFCKTAYINKKVVENIFNE